MEPNTWTFRKWTFRKMIFLFKRMIFRFHVIFCKCTRPNIRYRWTTKKKTSYFPLNPGWLKTGSTNQGPFFHCSGEHAPQRMVFYRIQANPPTDVKLIVSDLRCLMKSGFSYPCEPRKKKPGWLGYIGDEKTTQLCGDYIKRLMRIPFLTNQDSMESKGPRVFWTVAHVTFGPCPSKRPSCKSNKARIEKSFGTFPSFIL